MPVLEAHFPPEWNELARTLTASEGRLVVLVGGVDSGKTTFAAFLVNFFLASGITCAVVDADVGQSSIGPPGTIGLGFPDREVGALDEVPLAAFYFVGAISPQGHLLPCVVGTKRMVELALSGRLGPVPQKVVVDTTGLVHGRTGRVLKEYKLELLQPDHIVFFERRGELGSLARAWAERCRTHRLRVGAEVGRKTIPVRATRREEKWRSYFQGSVEHRFSFRDVVFTRTFLGTGRPVAREWREQISRSLAKEILWVECSPEQSWVVTPAELSEDELLWLRSGLGLGRSRLLRCHPSHFEGLLVGLVGRDGAALALGIVKRIDFAQEFLEVISPLPQGREVREIQFSEFRFPLGANLAGGARSAS